MHYPNLLAIALPPSSSFITPPLPSLLISAPSSLQHLFPPHNYSLRSFQRVTSASPVPAARHSSAEVQARISTAISTGRLDLSECGLQEVPPQVYDITDLEELSVAGNCITNLPDDIKNLKNLRRLGLAGNQISELPETVGSLKQLEGLWVHGNLLHSLPEQIGKLSKLCIIALAGNKLETLPDSICQLRDLQMLSVAGNHLEEIPSGIGELTSLKVLALHGNKLQALPPGLKHLTSLRDLWLQGNCLESLPSDLRGLSSMEKISLADNFLTSLPESMGQMTRLQSLWLYGNRLTRVPSSFEHLKQLSTLWLEGNPLETGHVQEFLSKVSHLKALGLDSHVNLVKGHHEALGKVVRASKIVGTGSAPLLGGYFKLEHYGENNIEPIQAEVVVVAFGSAPGVPNWGGLLRRVKSAMAADNMKPVFDILYVVDSRRSWYMENGIDALCHPDNKGNQTGFPKEIPTSSVQGQARSCYLDLFKCVKVEELRLAWYYKQELKEALKGYKRVIMLGDSMGASAALLFSTFATSIIAFCPQVDLLSSSIRPGKEAVWLSSFKEELMDAVKESSAKIIVHCGSWSHDLHQAKLLPPGKVSLVIHNVDDHQLAKVLDTNGSLLVLVKSRIEDEIKSAKKHFIPGGSLCVNPI